MATSGQSPKARQKGEAQDAMRSHVHQCMRDSLRPLVDRLVTSENHIEHIAAELLQGRERDVVLEQHEQALEKLESSIEQVSDNLNEVRIALDTTIKEQIARVEAESNEKIDALRSSFDAKLTNMQQVIETSLKIDIAKLQEGLTATNRHVAETIEPLISQQSKDHQSHRDQYFASEKVHSETKKFAERTHKTLRNLGADVEEHKEQALKNYQHIQEKTEGLADLNKNTDHRQDTLSEHLKSILINSRTARAKMEQVAEKQEEQLVQHAKMKKDHDGLFAEFKLIGKEVEKMFLEMEEANKPRDSGEDLWKQMKDEKDAKASKKTTSEFGGIAKAIADIAQKVKQNTESVKEMQEGINDNAATIQENQKRVGKYERFVTTVEIQVEKAETQVTDCVRASETMYAQIINHDKVIKTTGKTLEKTTEEVQTLNHSTRNLNETVGRLDQDVGLAHDYFHGLRSGFKETVVGEMLSPTSITKQQGSAVEALAALQAPAASFGRPKAKGRPGALALTDTPR
jgi:chromosome segregation ATPase